MYDDDYRNSDDTYMLLGVVHMGTLGLLNLV